MNTNNRFLRINDSETSKGVDQHFKRQYTALFDWFKRSLEYETFLLENTLRYQINQGEVYEIDFGRNVGSELNERHYAVVIHHSDPEAQNIVVVPLTTKIHYSYGEAIDLGFLPSVDTNVRSYAKISQIRTIDKARIYLRPIIENSSNGRTERKLGPVSRLSEQQFKLVLHGIQKLINNRL